MNSELKLAIPAISMTITYLQHKISRHKRLRMHQTWRVASVKYEGGYFTGGGGQGARSVGEGGVGVNAGLVS